MFCVWYKRVVCLYLSQKQKCNKDRNNKTETVPLFLEPEEKSNILSQWVSTYTSWVSKSIDLNSGCYKAIKAQR
jgi:hypothetical protein